jgi:hypothetical protein
MKDKMKGEQMICPQCKRPFWQQFDCDYELCPECNNSNNNRKKEIKTKYHTDAIKYMNKANKILKTIGKEEGFYTNVKYVKTACGNAYNGVLMALDGYFILQGIAPHKHPKSIEFYRNNLVKNNLKLIDYFNNAYKILHISGYYGRITNVKVIQAGFELAYDIIEKTKNE